MTKETLRQLSLIKGLYVLKCRYLRRLQILCLETRTGLGTYVSTPLCLVLSLKSDQIPSQPTTPTEGDE